MVEVLPRLYGLALEDWGVTQAGPPGAALGGSAAARWSAASPRCSGSPRPSTSTWRAPSPPRSRSRRASRRRCWCRRTSPRCRGRRPHLQLGRQLGRLRAGTYAVGRIPRKDLGLLVAAGVRTVFPDYGRGALPEEKLNDVAQKIARALPRRHRRAFEQAALSFRDGGVFDGERWRAAIGDHRDPRGDRRLGRRAGRVRAARARRSPPGRGGPSAARGAAGRGARQRGGRRIDQLRARRGALGSTGAWASTSSTSRLGPLALPRMRPPARGRRGS